MLRISMCHSHFTHALLAKENHMVKYKVIRRVRHLKRSTATVGAECGLIVDT